jgi:hypothetical protein
LLRASFRPGIGLQAQTERVAEVSEKPSPEGDGRSHLTFYGPDDDIVIHAVRAAYAILE